MKKLPDTFKAYLMINADWRPSKRNHRLGTTICSWAALGVLVLFLLGVLAGCGSDSTSSSGIKDKAIPPQAKANKIQKEPSQDNRGARELVFEVTPGMSAKEMARRAGAVAKKMPDPNFEILPGLTLKEIQAKQAAAAKKLPDPNFEIFPGLTNKGIQAKMAHAKKPDANLEIAPGLTLAEVKAKQAAAERKRASSPPEGVPGVTLDEIKAKQKAAQQNIKDLRVMDVLQQSNKP